MRLYPLLAPLVGVLMLNGCAADPIAPTLSIVAQAPATLTLGSDDEDDISLRLGYEDGDGDLGGGIVHLYDCRDDTSVLNLPIPVVASQEIVDAGEPIAGELIALIPDIAETSASAQQPAICGDLGITASADELVVCVTIEDSAGQESGGACSAPFALVTP